MALRLPFVRRKVAERRQEAGIFFAHGLQPQTLIDTDTLSVVRDGSTIIVHDHVADEVYTFRIVRVRRSEGVTESHTAIDTATISIDTIPHGGLKLTDKTAEKVYIVRRVGHG